MTDNRELNRSFPMAITDGLWVLGHYHFNLYLVRGTRESALIETGVSATADDVIRQLESLGVTPRYLVVNHPHADHINGLPALRERYPNSVVIAGRGAPEFLAHPKTAKMLVDEDQYMSRFLADQGYRFSRPPLQAPPSLDGALIKEDGEELDLGGFTLRFLAVRGHAAGNIVVSVPEVSALLVSDSLGFRLPDSGYFPIFFTGYKDYIGTIKRLKALKPGILGLAHQGPLTGPSVEKAFKEARRIAVDVRERIRRDSRDDDIIAQELYEEFYRDELMLYTPENILSCCRLIIKRSRE
jgi:2-aminobenzoylacetyl-CoA thioesterase